MARPRKEDFIATQVRIPNELNDYMEDMSKELHMPKSSFMVLLLTYGRNVYEKVKDHPEIIFK